MWKRRRSAPLLAALLALQALASAAAATSSPAADEAAFASFEAAATTGGALGFYSDPTTGEFVVVLPEAMAASFAVPDTASLGVRVRTETRSVTASQVAEAEARLAALHDNAALAGAAYLFYFSPRLGAMVMSGTLDSAFLKPLIADLGMPVTYTTRPVARYSRHSDFAPFWGGAETKAPGSPYPYDCTTGFVVKNAIGSKYMVTAAHCFAKNVQPFSPGSGQTQGTVVFRGPYPQFDMELMFLTTSPNYAPEIYTGGATGTGTYVNGATNPVTGRNIYCHSGASTYQQCNQTVENFTGQICDADGCTNNLITYDGGNPSAPGDSGAPFYLPGTKVGIRGMVIAGDGVVNLAQSWSQISSNFGVSIVTG